MSETGGKRECLCLEGSPLDRGLAYGKTLRAEIRELVGLWEKNLQRDYGIRADDFIKKFVNQTNYLSAIQKYTPGLLEEVKGIAQGCGLGFDTVYTFQLLDELILNAGDVAGHCSCIGVDRTENKPTTMGQNWDIESHVHGFQTVLHVREEESGRESFVFTYAGLIAALGVNNRGIGVCLNSLPILRCARKGLPVAYVVRGILANSTSERALGFVNAIEHASPQNYLIGDPEKVVDVECSSGRVVQFASAETPGVVCHTNHPLANDDYSPSYLTLLNDLELGQKTDELYHNAIAYCDANSGTRLASLRQQLSGLSPEAITVERIKSILASHDSPEHPICMDLGNGARPASIMSAVMELSDDPRFHVAFGPPDVTPFRTYSFSASRATTLDY